MTRFFIAAAVTVAFALLARAVRGVTTSGAIAGFVITFVLYAIAGPGAFAALATVFILAWITTRLGYREKQKLGTAEKREGRSASQVFANLGAAALCALLFATSKNPALLLAISAALSEAAADTVSSEFGQACSQQAHLITTWKLVPAGADGGITFVGTLAGAIAAALISLVSAFTGLIPWHWLWISTAAAILGTLLDSLLGAVLERRHLLNNDAVNFLSTVSAAVLGLLLSL